MISFICFISGAVAGALAAYLTEQKKFAKERSAMVKDKEATVARVLQNVKKVYHD